MSNESKHSPENSPFALKKTSLQGVYSFVPPPKGTDLTKASRTTQLKHGLLMRRPDPEKEPKRFALWTKFITETWTEENFIEPTFGPPGVVSRRGPSGGSRVPGGNVTSPVWSGVAVAGSWVGAMGVWKVPTVSQPATSIGQAPSWLAYTWVGMDGAAGVVPGATTYDVLQAGVMQSVLPDGSTTCTAFFEWFVGDYQTVLNNYPNQFNYVLPIPITSFTVSPGDVISVVTQYVKNASSSIGNPIPPAGPYSFGGVIVANVTTNKAVNLYLPPPPGASFAGDTAEWIIECPYGVSLPNGGDGGTLPKFTSIQFNEASACNVLDATPESYLGVELQKGTTIQFLDVYGNKETKSSGSLGEVNISYLG